MDFKQLVIRNRSYRRFHEEKNVDETLLTELVDTARLTPSARNLQPLKFRIVTRKKECEELFGYTAWAGYLTDGAPRKGERPSAYIVICNDAQIAAESRWDQGIVSQTILLGAAEKGLGGCIIASIRKKEISRQLNLPAHLEPVIVLAVGYPKEEVIITPVQNQDIKYYRDQQGRHYVPKRSLEEVLITD